MDVRVPTGLEMGFSEFWHVWANVGKFGWVKLIRRGWVTYLAGGCAYACRSRVVVDGYGLLLAYMGKGRARIGIISSGWVCICMQV